MNFCMERKEKMSAPHIKVRSQNSFHLDITREIASLEGHLFALPILFINLGGEMIYVIEHRLRAQNLEDRMDKVMQDVIGTIFRPRIIDELFKPQHLLSESSMRSLFQKLAHASIMSLNQDSMDKLLDLMTMTVKYQLFNCRYPSELIYCTLNHLDYMRDLVKHVDPISNSLRKVYNHIERTYCRMDQQNLVLLRNIVMRFFQDRKTRLSVFLNTGIQKETDGSMRIPSSFEISSVSQINLPGKITYYKTTRGVLSKETAETKTEPFPAGFFTVGPNVIQSTSFDTPIGGRGTKLGINVFANYKGPNLAHTVSTAPAVTGVREIRTNSADDLGEVSLALLDKYSYRKQRMVVNGAGAAEIAMLARILGGTMDKNDGQSTTTIELDFMTDLDDGQRKDSTQGQPGHSAQKLRTHIRATEIVRFELKQDDTSHIDLSSLDAILTDNNSRPPNTDDDWLQLMDEATKN